MTSRKCKRRNFELAVRFHHVLTEGRGKWEFNRLLFKTSPYNAAKILVQDSGEWVPQMPTQMKYCKIQFTPVRFTDSASYRRYSHINPCCDI
ncbi:hypothetical protein CEXT_369981 [Caerostris extrusa]|uniref:Uncharacterized protein n=1 Tax=Caerostris extrusa TaxID=172846 RepID=A0AAV4X119_CAEEX|nr:hypothetical protein CEXT_369981 [Caerostris extrusa]